MCERDIVRECVCVCVCVRERERAREETDVGNDSFAIVVIDVAIDEIGTLVVAATPIGTANTYPKP